MREHLTDTTNKAKIDGVTLQRAIETGVAAALAAMNIDNRIADAMSISGGDNTDMAKQKKIRRPIIINGEKCWINADSEQEYAE